jgi:hypothetical protein
VGGFDFHMSSTGNAEKLLAGVAKDRPGLRCLSGLPLSIIFCGVARRSGLHLIRGKKNEKQS